MSRQISLGGNASSNRLGMITVPTEVAPWYYASGGHIEHHPHSEVRLERGGELAFFTAERVDGAAIRNVEILSCGNGQCSG